MFSPQDYEKMCVSSRELVVSPSSGPGLGQGWGRCLEIMPSLSEPGWGNSLVVQWLELRVFTAEGEGTIPGWETKIWQTMQQNWEEREMERNQDCLKRVKPGGRWTLQGFLIAPSFPLLTSGSHICLSQSGLSGSRP